MLALRAIGSNGAASAPLRRGAKGDAGDSGDAGEFPTTLEAASQGAGILASTAGQERPAPAGHSAADRRVAAPAQSPATGENAAAIEAQHQTRPMTDDAAAAAAGSVTAEAPRDPKFASGPAATDPRPGDGAVRRAPASPTPAASAVALWAMPLLAFAEPAAIVPAADAVSGDTGAIPADAPRGASAGSVRSVDPEAFGAADWGTGGAGGAAAASSAGDGGADWGADSAATGSGLRDAASGAVPDAVAADTVGIRAAAKSSPNPAAIVGAGTEANTASIASGATPPVLAIAASGGSDRPGTRPDEGSGATVATVVAQADAGAGMASATAGAAPATASSGLADGGAADVLGQVAGNLTGALAAGRLEVVLRLHPPELGELSVRMQMDGRDVTAWFQSPLPQVQQALSQGMEQLQAGLANAGFNLNDAWVGGDAWKPRGSTAPAAPRPGQVVGAASPAATSAGGAVRSPAFLVSLYV